MFSVFVFHFCAIGCGVSVSYWDSHRCMFSLKIWEKYENYFWKMYIFSEFWPNHHGFLLVLVVLVSLLGEGWEGRREKGREVGREREGERTHPCERFYFSVRRLLELLSSLRHMCIRSKSGRNHGTAAIPDLIVFLKNLDIIYRIVGRYSLFFSFPWM